MRVDSPPVRLFFCVRSEVCDSVISGRSAVSAGSRPHFHQRLA